MSNYYLTKNDFEALDEWISEYRIIMPTNYTNAPNPRAKYQALFEFVKLRGYTGSKNVNKVLEYFADNILDNNDSAEDIYNWNQFVQNLNDEDFPKVKAKTPTTVPKEKINEWMQIINKSFTVNKYGFLKFNNPTEDEYEILGNDGMDLLAKKLSQKLINF